jgi:hypothetical protein
MTASRDWLRPAIAEEVKAVRSIDPNVAHIARVQDYWLGGKDHFEADRIAGDEAIAALPDMVASVRNTRAFLGRTVRYLAGEADADIRAPEEILGQAAQVLDFSQPVGVVLMAVLQFVPDADDPHAIVRRIMAGVPAGSYLVISHPASDIQAAAMAGMATRLNQLMAQQVKPRGRAEVTAFFDGLELVPPGVIRCPEWRPDRPEDAAGKSTMWGGVATKA